MPTESTTPLLLAALRRVLQPLVRFMLKQGVSYTQLTELMKTIFIEVADREFSLNGKPQTDSRLSLLTGIHRKDVKRLREMVAKNDQLTIKAIPLSAQILAGWMTLPGFQDDQGRPLPLARQGEVLDEVSFDALVMHFSTDIRPRAVLDEWLCQGMVFKDTEERIHLNTASFVPQAGFEDKLYYYGHNLHDHLAAATHNLCEPGMPFLERSVHYNRLPPETVRALNALAEARGMELLYELNSLASKASQLSAESTEPGERFTCGVYFFKTNSESAE